MTCRTAHPFNFRRQLHRRTVLRGSGVAMSLPWLTAMQPSFAARDRVEPPKRFVAMTLGLGLVAENLFPENAWSRLPSVTIPVRHCKIIRDQVTVVSGVSHPGVKGGHRAEASILTGSPMGTSGRAKNTISIDQLMAKYLGDATRFPSLVLSTGGNTSPCYTETVR